MMAVVICNDEGGVGCTIWIVGEVGQGGHCQVPGELAVLVSMAHRAALGPRPTCERQGSRASGLEGFTAAWLRTPWHSPVMN